MTQQQESEGAQEQEYKENKENTPHCSSGKAQVEKPKSKYDSKKKIKRKNHEKPALSALCHQKQKVASKHLNQRNWKPNQAALVTANTIKIIKTTRQNIKGNIVLGLRSPSSV